MEGKILSINLSVSLDIFLASTVSAPRCPVDALSISKNSAVFPLLALNFPATLSINLSILLLAMSNFLPRPASLITVEPIPPITPVNKAPSVPNLTLFNKSLTASSPSPLSILVGPPIKSPKLPIFCTSPTKTPSATPPPKAPTMN